jgi:hypothetical protein
VALITAVGSEYFFSVFGVARFAGRRLRESRAKS